MITAHKRGPWARMVARYVDRKVRRAFRGVWLTGTLPPPDSTLLIYANHTNFWDGFALHVLCRAAGWDGYCLMEEQNLARYRFLRRLGAFSIRRGDARSAVESLRYAAGLLERPGRAVIVFPEGELRPWSGVVHPLERGIVVLARRAHAVCLPVAVRYRFFEHELPDLLLAAGEPHAALDREAFEERLRSLVAELAEDRPLTEFTLLRRGRRSAMERWDVARGRAGG